MCQQEKWINAKRIIQGPSLVSFGLVNRDAFGLRLAYVDRLQTFCDEFAEAPWERRLSPPCGAFRRVYGIRVLDFCRFVQ